MVSKLKNSSKIWRRWFLGLTMSSPLNGKTMSFFFLFLFIICDCSYLACYVCICYIGGKTLKAMTCWDKVLLMPFWWHSMRKRLWMHLRFTLIMLSSPRYFHLLLRRLWWWISHLLLSKHQHELEDIQAIKVFMFEEYAYLCVCVNQVYLVCCC